MLMSMTGYGRAQASFERREITVELKSVNNRYLDCNVKLPRLYVYAEDAVKQRVQAAISRGKVDVFVVIDNSGKKNVSISVDRLLLEGYLEAFRGIYEEYDIKKDISMAEISRLPDVLSVKEEEDDLDELKEQICKVTDMALAGFSDMRAREGKKLLEDMRKRLDIIEEITNQVEIRSPKTVEEYRAKLEQRMREVLESISIDEGRLMTEAAIFADRVAVNEELVRLHSHLSQMRQLLDSKTPAGRKMDFLIQEMNREINTIGSKGNDIEIAKYVVDLKSEVEKIREQAQNVE